METTRIYILIAVFTLAIIAFLIPLISGKSRRNQLTPLTGLAFGFVIAGAIFGDNRLIGLGLIGIGVLLSVADIMIKYRKKAQGK